MHRLTRMLVTLSFGVLGVAGTSSTLAQDASPVAVPSGIPSGCTVVADGLNNPRYVAIADDGTLYLTEAGNGGDEVVTPAQSEESATPVEGEEGGPPPTRGESGQVTTVSPDGAQSVLADGLPTYGEGIGPTGVALGDGVIWISVGGAAVSLGAEPLDNENSVLQIDVATGDVAQIANIGPYEDENNPDGTDVNPNLYGMDLGAAGQLYLNDAGGNTVYKVDPATGDFSLFGVVPGPEVPGGAAAEASPPAEVEAESSPIAEEEEAGPPQPVPTGLHVGADAVSIW